MRSLRRAAAKRASRTSSGGREAERATQQAGRTNQGNAGSRNPAAVKPKPTVEKKQKASLTEDRVIYELHQHRFY